MEAQMKKGRIKDICTDRSAKDWLVAYMAACLALQNKGQIEKNYFLQYTK